MSGWPIVSLGSLAEFRNGLNYSAEHRGSGLAVVGVRDFQDYSFVRLAELEELDPSALQSNESLVRKDDILFVRSNGNRELIGRSLFVSERPHKPTSHSGFTIRLRFTDPRVLPVFYAYFLRGGVVCKLLSSQGGGTSINNLNQGILARLEVPLPAIHEQRRIASILGAYDDLIEVNRRRVAVLEAMARGLFEEWFVRFRFPGHENHKIIDTPDGPLPEGWKLGKIADVVKLRSGFAFKSSTFVDGGQYGLVTIKHVHNGDLIPPFDSRLAEIPPQMPAFCRTMDGDILLSLTGNVGRTCLAWGEDLLLNQRVAKIEPVARNSRAFAYAFFRLPWTRTALENISNGAAQQNLSPVRTMEMPIKIPCEDLFSRFELVVGPMLDAVVGIKKSTAVLTAQHDLLLPRLISGELSVAAAEAELEAAV